MDFPKLLKQCQLQRHMTNDTFSKFIGKSRTWLQWIYSKNPKVEKYLLSERTIYDLHEKLYYVINKSPHYSVTGKGAGEKWLKR